MSFTFSQPSGEFPMSQEFTSAQRSSGKKRARTAMEIQEIRAPSQVVKQIIARPLRSKRRKLTNEIHRFKRTFDVGASTIVTNTINPVLVAFNFSMNDMPGYTELTSLFDYYKLTGVKVRAIPYLQNMSNSVGTVNNSGNAPIFYTIDRSDANAPSGVSEILEYNDHKVSSLWKGFSVWIPNPKFADATSAVRGGWVATSNASLNWFGLKVAIPPTQASASLYITITFYVSCKDAK